VRAQRPAQRAEQRARLRAVVEPGGRPFVLRGQPQRAEQVIPERQQLREVVVEVFGTVRVMQAVVLRIVDPRGKAAQVDAQVHMREVIAEHENDRGHTDNPRLDLEQHAHQRIEQAALDEHFEPVMPERHRDIEFGGAVVQRMQLPQHGPCMLQAVKRIFEQIDRQ